MSLIAQLALPGVCNTDVQGSNPHPSTIKLSKNINVYYMHFVLVLESYLIEIIWVLEHPTKFLT